MTVHNSSHGNFSFDHAYQLRLIDDEELMAKAETIFSADHLLSKNHTLDSGIFGATLMNPICDICCQRVERCPGHYAVIQLPFPIVRAICLKDFKAILPAICPICSKFLCENAKLALKLNPENRLPYIRKEVDKYTRNGEENVVCPHCRRMVTTVKIIGCEPTMKFCITQDQQSLSDQINPCHVYTILQNFTECAEAGFAPSYHPKNFMTTLIPIIPNKLRLKTMLSSESTLTSYYKVIVEEICPELAKIYKSINQTAGIVIPYGDVLNTFTKYYDKLMAYYLLITDMGSDKNKEVELQLIEKRDRKHVDDHNQLIGRFKGKEKSIFSKGIIGTRVNVSARTVLGGAIDTRISGINVPYHIARKMHILYPVYEQNLKIMKQILASMSDPKIYNDITIPKVLYVYNGATDKLSKVTIKDALTKAALLKPGDKLGISLIDGDFLLQSRFPAVREESWSSFQVNKDNNSIITIPLPDCEMKMADFDGDEAQVYALLAHYTDIESLLLHSTFQQLIAYKDGNPAIWYQWTNDIPYGIQKIKPGVTSIIRHSKLVKEPVNVIKELEQVLPKDLRYVDGKTDIIDGKFINENTNCNNAEFHKYLASLYGAERTEQFMDDLIQLSYDVNRDQGCTLGYDIRIFGDGNKKKITDIIENLYRKMCFNEQKNIPHKDLIQITEVEKLKVQVKEILLTSAKGTMIDIAGHIKNRQDEYYQTVVMCDHVIIDGMRVKPIMAEGSRVNSAFPRYSLDPCAYGFIKGGYNSDISPIATFYEAKQQRASLFEKGKGTAKQGYMSKRLGVTFGTNFVDFNGCLVNNIRMVGTQYGACGLNPRLFVKQPLIDIDMDRKEFSNKYSKRCVELYDKIHEYMDRYARITNFTKSDSIKREFIAGFNYEQLINNFGTKGKTEDKDIEDLIKRIYDIYTPPEFGEQYIRENLTHHEYYFRVKLANIKIDENIMNKIYDQFEWSLADGGDPVGVKASLSCSEPLTQASLHAIHHAGGGDVSEERLNRSAGLARFEELLGGNKCKDTVLTFTLYDDSKENCVKWANEQETFYFNSVWTRLELIIRSNIPNEILEIHPTIPLKDLDVNPYFIKAVWNVSKISGYNIHICDVMEAMVDNFEELMFITGYVINSTEFMAYMYFKNSVTLDRIHVIMEEWKQEKESTIVHGKYLCNCYVSENKNRPGHFIIEANEVGDVDALKNLIINEEIDPSGCKSTNIVTTEEIFGLSETSTRFYEELIYTATNLSVTSGVLHRHYKVLADAAYTSGSVLQASRNSLRRDIYTDSLRMIQFETARDMIHQDLNNGFKHPVADPVSASVYAEMPSCGTGISKITIY